MILVVGATGQLGSLAVRGLRAAGEPVRAMVRDTATADDLAATGAELVVADLRVPETLDASLDRVTAVVATANSVAPTRAGDSAEALDAGYAELVRRADAAGVSRSSSPACPPRTWTIAYRWRAPSAHGAAPGRLRPVLAVAAHAAVLRGLARPGGQRTPPAR